LIVAHKFYHQRMYRGGALSVPCEFKTFWQTPSLSAGLFLISIFILVGWIVETIFKHINKRLSDWRTLGSFILGLYFLIGLNFLYLHQNAMKDKEFKLNITEANQLLEKIWSAHGQPLNPDTASYYNARIFSLTNTLRCQANRSMEDWPIFSREERFCRERVLNLLTI
jgi:hypothetical protein